MKAICVFFILVIMNLLAHGQGLEIVTNSYGRSTFNEIVDNGAVVEYYSYLNAEFAIYDMSLQYKGQFVLGRSNDSRLLEVTKCSSHYLFVFLNSKNNLDFEIYTDKGEITGKWTLSDLSVLQEMQISSLAIGRELDYNLVFPVVNAGFVIQLPTREKNYGMAVKMLDFKANIIWSWNTESGANYFGDVLAVSAQSILITLNQKDAVLGSEMEFICKALRTNDGKEIFSRNMIDKGEQTLCVQWGFTEFSGAEISHVIIGEYFRKGKNALRDKSEGIFIQTLDSRGEEKRLKKLSWDIELKELTSSTRNASLLIQNAVRTGNGEIVLVAEQYRKTVNMGTALSNLVFDDDDAILEIQIHDLVVFRFSETGELISQYTINNPVRHIAWDDGSAIQSSVVLARRIKKSGYFAYRFSSVDNSNEVVRVVYSLTFDPEYRRKKHADIIIGVVESRSGYTNSFKVPLISEVSLFGLYGAKPGFITLAEYSPKFDLLQLKLVELKPTL
ncbi:MAG: hypothetical protein RL204_2415 [Bacteroidota bacterium]